MIGIIGFTIFTTWHKGRRIVTKRVERTGLNIDDFVHALAKNPPSHHPGVGVYLHRLPGRVPPALLTNLRHNNSLHERIVFVSVTIDSRPTINKAQRDQLTRYDLGFAALEMHYGFTDRVDLVQDLYGLVLTDMNFDPDDTTFFLGRERIEVVGKQEMARWRERMFAYLARNAGDPARHFGLPAERAVDIGTHIEL